MFDLLDSALDNRKVMKMSKKILAVCLMLTVILSGVTIIRVAAETTPMTAGQIDQIRNNCVSAKNTLSQLHASDALLRVNRGQIFESMSTKLMDRFNSRVANNGYNNTGLISVSRSYGAMLDTFRLDYKTYEEHLSTAINVDCWNQPAAFYDAVATARTLRNVVHADVVKLNQYIDQYKSAIDQFEQDYQTVVNGIKQ